MELRPAHILTRERLAKETARNTESYRRTLAEVVKSIEEAHRIGHTSINILSIPANVVDHLKENGYRVDFHPACHMGDMDSHTISWD